MQFVIVYDFFMINSFIIGYTFTLSFFTSVLFSLDNARLSFRVDEATFIKFLFIFYSLLKPITNLSTSYVRSRNYLIED